jgi:hypothetical protein
VADQRTEAPLAAQTPSGPGEEAPLPSESKPAAVVRPVESSGTSPGPTRTSRPAETAKKDLTTSSRPTITFGKTLHDYGEIGPRSRNVCEFRFKNTGTAVLKVEPKIDSSCGCTVPTLAKTDYAPGEEGEIKVTYSAGSAAATARKYLTVHCNDPKHPTVKLAIVAKIVPRVTYEPKQLDLLLKDGTVTCPPVTLRSLDGAAFSVTNMVSSGNCLAADLDPSVQATQFTIQLTPDAEKLQKFPMGYLAFTLTHPECEKAAITFKTRSGYQFAPAMCMWFNAKPNVPAQRIVHLANDQGEDFEIASFSSERNLVKVVEKTKLPRRGNEGARYRLLVSVTPPTKKTDAERAFADSLSVRLTNGQELKLNCRGFYAATSARAN